MKIIINIEKKHLDILDYLRELTLVDNDIIIQRLLEQEATAKNYFDHLKEN